MISLEDLAKLAAYEEKNGVSVLETTSGDFRTWFGEFWLAFS